MYSLRLTQSSVGVDRHRVELALEGSGQPRVTAVSEFEFALTPQDREDIRWYLEEYLQYPLDPAPKVAGRIEQRMESIGRTLFQCVFGSDEDTRDLWATLRGNIGGARIEVVTDVEEAASMPWELIRDSKTDVPLALRASAFVRSQPNPAQRPFFPKISGNFIRILLIICRPGGSHDVPFRSVASRLVKGLGEDARSTFELHVLRPPSFERLANVLRRAKLDGNPYHVVHFDGHGVYGGNNEESGENAAVVRQLSPVLLSSNKPGKHGFLLFEHPGVENNSELISGQKLGNLLAECNVPVLVLNACRSAHADPPPQPAKADLPANKGANPHEQVRAFGSLAQEVMDAGVAGVVAMRYNVYVVTAAQFVADLYTSLVQGDALGVAVSNGRKQLAAQPLREISLEPLALQDWMVPVVFEAAPITLFEKAIKKELSISVRAGEFVTSLKRVDEELPARPDVGFFGRDEALLALDRAFDQQSVVLLHAYAGSGKTSTVVEFARWYAQTGGTEGPTLFTSFEQYKPLGRVLDRFGTAFGPELAQAGVHWLALDDQQREYVALQVMKQIPVLWIWDNIETIAGFPAGVQSAWQPAERNQLKEFLRAASETKAKILLTSRRHEREWLGEIPARIELRGMPLQERVQLARALAGKYGRKLSQLGDWRALFDFTGGNPLTITVVVGQALRQGLQTKRQIDNFVSELRAGSAKIEDDETQGREHSLGASLGYGFQHNFNAAELKILALLYLFQGTVWLLALSSIIELNQESQSPEIPTLAPDAITALLDRASDVGLLQKISERIFVIHPALPWYFKALFERTYVDHLAITRDYVKATAQLGRYIDYEYTQGNRDFLFAFEEQEQNLLHAFRLARANEWWQEVVGLIGCFEEFYRDSGREPEYFRLLIDIVPDFVDPATDEPRSGKESWWAYITQQRAGYARASGDLKLAERLLHRLLSKARERATTAIEKAAENWDESDKHAANDLASALHSFGIMQWSAGRPECIQLFEESLKLYEQLEQPANVAVSAFHLGHAYMDLPAIRDLDKAEYWYTRRLEIEQQRGDPLGIGMALHELGQTAYVRFQHARQQNQDVDNLRQHIEKAINYANQALDAMPEDAMGRANQIHHLLGNIYDDIQRFDLALPHYQRAIEYSQRKGDTLYAATARRETARGYLKCGRLPEALDYALAALRDVESFGGSTPGELKMSRDLVTYIQSLIANTTSK